MRNLRRDKYLEVRRAQGFSFFVDARPTYLYLVKLRFRYGMTLQQIADASGCGIATASEILSGKRTRIAETTEQKILAVRPIGGTRSVDGNEGVRVPATGTRRRLNALALEGWTSSGIVRALNLAHPNRVTCVYEGRKFVTFGYATAVRGLYESDAQPSSSAVGRREAIRQAKMRQAAPRHCWDDDTIDDPESIAEWTGACGTLEGFYIHRRDEGRTHWRWINEEKTKGMWVTGCEPCRLVRSEKVRQRRMSRSSTESLSEGSS